MPQLGSGEVVVCPYFTNVLKNVCLNVSVLTEILPLGLLEFGK